MPRFPKTIDGLTFDEWVDYVFNPSNYDKHTGYRKFEADEWIGEQKDQDTAVSYLAQLFENSGKLLSQYSNQEVHQGLLFLSNNSFSNYMSFLVDEDIAWPKRDRAIQSFYDLQSQVFAIRCDEGVQPLHNEPGSLCWLCFTWFNCTPPIYAQMLLAAEQDANFLRLNTALLNVMEKTLQLESSECQFSALHGLGLWHQQFPTQVDGIITKFLNRKRSKWIKDVRQYAKKARHGEVQDWC